MAHLQEPWPPLPECSATIPLFKLRGNIMTRPTCEWLQERRNLYILPGLWSKPGNIGNSLSPFLFYPSSPSLCSIVKTSTQTQARWFFGTLVLRPLGLLAFWIKLLFLALTSHLSMCCAASSVSLDSVTISTQNPHCWCGRGQGQVP